MKRYIVSGEVTISVHAVVEAESEEAAREKADEATMMGLCHQCASSATDDWNGAEDEWRTSGEIDGSVNVTTVEEP